MFEKILLSVDTSEDSEKAVQITKELARVHGSRVHVVHGREQPLVNPSGRTTPPVVMRVETVDEAQQLVDEAVSELQSAGVSVRGEVLPGQGRLGRRILDAAETDGADLIILGSRAMSRMEEVIIGSVSNKIVHTANCPVLLVR